MENIKLDTYVVKSGDTLMKIAKEQLGDANRYMEIAKLNNISDPDLIYPGEKFELPSTNLKNVETLDLIDEEININELTNKISGGTAGIENSTFKSVPTNFQDTKTSNSIDEEININKLTNKISGGTAGIENSL